MLAARYRDCPYVIGHDLRNEVRFCPYPLRWPSTSSGIQWISGAVDWAEAARQCAEIVSATAPHALIVVERVIWPMHELDAYVADPGPLLPRFRNKLVLGVHHYAWQGPGRYLAFGHNMKTGINRVGRALLRGSRLFSPENYGDMPTDGLREEIRRQWSYLLEDDRCPVWVSEFGACENKDGYDFQWLQRFAEITGEMDIDYAYWPLNVGRKPGQQWGEPYGMLAADWTPKPGGDPRLELFVAHGLLPRR